MYDDDIKKLQELFAFIACRFAEGKPSREKNTWSMRLCRAVKRIINSDPETCPFDSGNEADFWKDILFQLVHELAVMADMPDE